MPEPVKVNVIELLSNLPAEVLAAALLAAKPPQGVSATVSNGNGSLYILSNCNVSIEGSMRDQYNAQQAGIVGPNARVTNMTVFQNAWEGLNSSVDLPLLATELEQLRNVAKSRSTDIQHDEDLLNLRKAEEAAKEKDGSKVMEYLSKTSEWLLGIAKEITVEVAVKAITASAGLPA